MKKYTLILFLICLGTSTARANPIISIDIGKYHKLSKTITAPHATFILASIREDKLGGWEIIAGRWQRKETWRDKKIGNSGKFVGLDHFWIKQHHNLFAKFNLGASRLWKPTKRLGTPFQFHFGVSIGYKVGTSTSLGCGAHHFSNGKNFHRRTSRNNHAEDFLTCGLQRRF